MSTQTRQNQIFTLPDGRRLGYAEYGDPTGIPLLYFHGYPACRLEAYPLEDMARRQKVRLIALDRPGFGLSTSQPNRIILDWPTDVSNFAKGMQISRFAVIGVSGGGPYALACAHTFTKRRLMGVGLFASAPPWAAGAYHMSVYRRVMSLMASHWPGGLQALLNGLVRATQWITSTRPVMRRIESWLEHKKHEKTGAVENVLQDAAIGLQEKKTTSDRRLELINALLDEPFAQGAEAAVHEAKLLSSMDWGFPFEDVKFRSVRSWHGAKDQNAPATMIRYMAERLPHCIYHEFDDDTHYTMYKHLEGAIAEIMSEQEIRGEV